MSAIEYANVAAHRRVPNNAKRPIDGYGRKIPTDHQVQLAGESTWRKVYAICFSNAASFYIIVKGKSLYIHDADMD